MTSITALRTDVRVVFNNGVHNAVGTLCSEFRAGPRLLLGDGVHNDLSGDAHVDCDKLSCF